MFYGYCLGSFYGLDSELLHTHDYQKHRTRQLVLGIIPALMRNRLVDRLFKADAIQEFYYGYKTCLAGQP